MHPFVVVDLISVGLRKTGVTLVLYIMVEKEELSFLTFFHNHHFLINVTISVKKPSHLLSLGSRRGEKTCTIIVILRDLLLERPILTACRMKGLEPISPQVVMLILGKRFCVLQYPCCTILLFLIYSYEDQN